jgi:hypothetical protein
MTKNNPDLTQLRKEKKLLQADFWPLFGVTESGGYRYKAGKTLVWRRREPAFGDE